MLASELVSQLQVEISRYGDLEVEIFEPGDESVGIWDYTGEIKSVGTVVDVDEKMGDVFGPIQIVLQS